MIPLTLQLKNFMSYREGVPPLDLRGVHVACLCGSNGHGKSALLDAMTWALWGWARGKRFGQGGASPDELVHQGQREMEVALEFLSGDRGYRVLRKYSRATAPRQSAAVMELQVSVGDGFRSISEASLPETERKLRQLLRMDYETFINSAFLLQGQADRFTTATPARRKEVLGQILELAFYDRLAEASRERTRSSTAEAQALQHDIEELDRQLAAKPTWEEELRIAQEALKTLGPRVQGKREELVALQSALQRLQGRQKEVEGLRHKVREGQNTHGKLERERQGIQGRIQAYRSVLARKGQLEADLERLREHAEQASQDPPAVQQKRDDLQDLRGHSEVLKAENQRLKEEMVGLRDRLDLLTSSDATTCPLCGTPLGAEGREHLRQELEGQGLERKATYVRNQEALHLLQARQRETEQQLKHMERELVRQREELGRRSLALEREMEQCRAAEREIPAALDSVERIQGLLEEQHKEIEATEAELVSLEQELRGLAELEQQFGKVNREYHQMETEQGDLRGKIAFHEATLKQLAQREREKEQKAEALKAALEQQADYDLLAEAFGKRGIQALLIEAALPELEAEANHLLARLTDNRMHLTLETQHQSRRGTVEETLEIKVADELGTRSYELFSGGEAFRINFALRVALARFLARRAGAPLRALFIDEGFGTQDAQGRERLVEAIQAIQEEFDLILVITHIEELKEAFPVRIEVSKSEAGSTFQVAWS